MDIIDYSIIMNIFIQFRSKLVSLRVKHTGVKLSEITNLGHTLIKNYPFLNHGYIICFSLKYLLFLIAHFLAKFLGNLCA